MSRRRRRIDVISGGGVGKTGLQLWLDAADTSTITDTAGAVNNWADKSGVGNDVTQVMGSMQPTTNATTLNGKNIIDFDGGDTLIMPSALHELTNGSNTVFAVSKRTTETAAIETVIGMQESSSTRFILAYSAVAGELFYRSNNSAGGAASKTGAVNTSFQILRGRRVGTTQAVTYNGVVEGVNSNGADEPGVDTAFIGSVNGASFFLAGSIAEVIVYNRVLSTAEMLVIEDYLCNKWGI